MIKKLFFIVLSVFSFASGAECFPLLTGRVVDDAHILTNQQKKDLEQVLEQAHPHQVVAVSLKSLEGQEIEEYGYQLGRHWGIGRKDENDGVLVLIAPNDGQLRIEVGYGLEHILTDAQSSRIINNVMLPLARNKQYDESLIQGSKAVVGVLNGDFVNQPDSVQQDVDVFADNFLIICLLYTVFIIIVFLGSGYFESKMKSYKTNSKQNRFLFFYENVFMQSLFYNFYAVFLGAASRSFFTYLVVSIPIFVLCNLGNLRRFIKNPKFPYKKITSKGGNSGGSSGISHSSSWDSGGSSFHGGGGSFGGGGASGRF